jgi:hypothetical protein
LDIFQKRGNIEEVIEEIASVRGDKKYDRSQEKNARKIEENGADVFLKRSRIFQDCGTPAAFSRFQILT